MTEQRLQLVDDSPGPLAPENFQHAMLVAKGLAGSELVPAEYRRKPENVLIALESAHRLGISPLVAMNNLYVIKGRPMWGSPFQIGLVNTRAGLKETIQWEISPEDWKTSGSLENLVVTCFAVRHDGVRVEESVGWKRVRAEGWDKNEKYRTMPVIMMKYRSAAALIRQHWPQILLGFYMDVEEEDFSDAAPDRAEDLPPGPTIDAEIV